MRTLINVVTGEVTTEPLSQEESAMKALKAQQSETEAAERQARKRRAQFMEQLIEKIDADPTILDRIK